MNLSFRTVRSEQAVETQIRLLLNELSDQGLFAIPAASLGQACILKLHIYNFKINYSDFFSCPKFC